MLKPTTLKISDATTLRDLQAFSQDTKQESQNLRGRKVDGQIQLYSSPKNKGLAGALNKINPAAVHGRWVAQKGLKKIFANHEKVTGAPVSEALSQHARKPLSGNVKMGVLHVTSTIGAMKADQDDEKVFGAKTGPDIHALGLQSPQVKALVTEAADLIRKENLLSKVGDEQINSAKDLGQKLGDIKQKLGDVLYKNFESTDPSDEQRRDFSMSLGDEVVQQLTTELRSQAFPGAKLSQMRDAVQELVLDVALSAYDRAASKAAPDQFVSDHEFRLGGVTYKADPEAAPLGTGGFGTVRAFTAENGTKIEVATKIPNMASSSASQRQLATRAGIKEYAMHQITEGSGHANVLSMKGAMRMPNGGFAVVLEIAKYGDVNHFSKDLRAAAKAGIVSPQDALLAQRVATRDMLQGLQHSHQNGVTNQDVKDENYLIDSHGVIKLGDNGAARLMDGIQDNEGTSTKNYLSPEMEERNIAAKHTHLDKVFGVGAEAVGKNPNDVAIRQLVDRQFPKASDEEKDTLVSQYKKASRQQVLEGLTAKRDGFALGLAANSMIYQKDYSGREGGTDHYSNYTIETSRLQSLVADLSNPRFEQRTSPNQALQDAALKLSPEQIKRGREIIVSVAEWGRANRG